VRKMEQRQKAADLWPEPAPTVLNEVAEGDLWEELTTPDPNFSLERASLNIGPASEMDQR
jgi:hypothetical protein